LASFLEIDSLASAVAGAPLKESTGALSNDPTACGGGGGGGGGGGVVERCTAGIVFASLWLKVLLGCATSCATGSL
jgi:hypothetical protein